MKRLLRVLATAISITSALSACSRLPNPAPEPKMIASSLGPLCEVQSSGEASYKPRGVGNFRVASREFVALCRAANPAADKIGPTEPLRVRGIMSWDEYQSMGGDLVPYSWTPGKVVEWLDDPQATRPPSGEFSDAPQCHLLVKRFAQEVVPCVRAANAPNGDALAALVEREKVQSRMTARTGNVNAAILDLDARCIERWLLINRQIDQTREISACRFYIAPDQLNAMREADAARAKAQASSQR
jgi:hypothetical protein